jgi:hypothetical protein
MGRLTKSLFQEALITKLFMAIYMPVIAQLTFYMIHTVGCIFFMTKKKPCDSDTLYACSLSMVYAFVLYVMGGFWFSNDKADRRDKLMDQAEQRIRESGAKLTVSNLKAAMRSIEQDEDAEYADYLESKAPTSQKGY